MLAVGVDYKKVERQISNQYEFCFDISWAGANGQGHQLFIIYDRPWPDLPTNFYVVGLDLARPKDLSSNGPRPGPPRPCFSGRTEAPPNPSYFQEFTARPGQLDFIVYLPGLAQPMTMEVRPLRHGLHPGRPDLSVGRLVEWSGSAMDRPICCPLIKGEHVG